MATDPPQYLDDRSHEWARMERRTNWIVSLQMLGWGILALVFVAVLLVLLLWANTVNI